MGKWTDELIAKELLELTKNLGRFPGATTLQAIKRYDLCRAISRRGGMMKFRELTKHHLNCKPRNFWNKTTAEIEFSKIATKLGRCPFSIELAKLNSGLSDFIYRNNLYSDLRRKFKYKPKIKPCSFWKDWDNVLICLTKDFGKLISDGIFPTRAMMMQSSNCRSVVDAIIKYHGGFKKTAARLNCVPKNNMIAPDGHFVDSTYELVFDWYLWSRGIKHELHGHISPNHRYRFDFKVKNIYFEIWGLNSQKYIIKRRKKERLYKQLGLKLISLERKLFEQNIENIEKSLDEIFSSLNIPCDKIKNKFDIKNSVNNKGYWSFSNTLKELKLVIEQLQKFPTIRDLRAINMAKLIKPIYKHGGLNFFKKQLGYPVFSHENWTQEKIIEKISKLKINLNHFPVTSEIKSHDPKLLDAIFRTGGLKHYRSLVC